MRTRLPVAHPVRVRSDWPEDYVRVRYGEKRRKLMRVHLALVLAAPLVLLGGCSSETEPVTPVAICPASTSSPQGSCQNEGLACPFSAGLTACPALAVTATCAQGAWQGEWPAACEPIPPNAPCDPFGTWAITFTSPGGCPPPDNLTLEVTTTAAGLPLVHWVDDTDATLDAAEVAPDGCAIGATASDSFYDPTYGHGYSTTYEVSLALSGTSATGVLTCEQTGYLNGSFTTPVTATRL